MFILQKIYNLNSFKDDEEKNFEIAHNIYKEIGQLLEQKTNIIDIYIKYKEVFGKIKKNLNSETKSQELIRDFKNFYNISNSTLIEEITILFHAKKYESDINSIIFFFKYFCEYNNLLSNEKYENISSKDYLEMKSILIELKEKQIYDYKSNKNCIHFFRHFYNKKEAFEFLKKLTKDDFATLKERVQPTNSIVNLEDIENTEECWHLINKMERMKDNYTLLNYVSYMVKRLK